MINYHGLGGLNSEHLFLMNYFIEKAREFQKNIYFCFIDYAKAFVWITTNWKIPKEMGILDHLTCLLRNCVQVKKQQLDLDMEQLTGSKLGKEYIKGVYSHPCLFNLCAEYIMRNVQLNEAQAGIDCQEKYQ